MEAGAREVQLALVGRHDRRRPPRAARGSAARRRRRTSCPAGDGHVGRGETARLAVEQHEHLAPLRVHDGERARRARGEGVERRDAGDRDAEREREPAHRREPDPHPGEAAGADADRDRVDVGGPAPAPGAAARRRPRAPSTAREQRSPSTSPSSTSALVAHVGGRVDGEDQHSKIRLLAGLLSALSSTTSLCVGSTCRNRDRDAHAAAARRPRPRGHSTKQTAPSKYGSRSPHSAGETEAKRYRSRWETGTRPS